VVESLAAADLSRAEDLAMDLFQLGDDREDDEERRAQERFRAELMAQAGGGDPRPWSFPAHSSDARKGLLEPVRVVSVAAGEAHAILLDDQGALFGIGRATEGQLGCGDLVSGVVETGVAVQALRGRAVVHIAAGGWHSLAVDDLGVAFVWGDNRFGQCGAGEGLASVRLPTEVAPSTVSGDGALGGACGLRHTVIIRRRDRASWVAGSNAFGQCGTGASAAAGRSEADSDATDDDAEDSGPEGAPAQGDGQEGGTEECIVRFRLNRRTCKTEAARVACGHGHTALLSETGMVWTFGRGDAGQLGLGSRRSFRFPQLVRGLPDEWCTGVAAGATHTVVLTESGDVLVAGRGPEGQLGLGSASSQADSFTRMRGLPPISRVAAGSAHSAAIAKDTGQLFVWGQQSNFRLGIAKVGRVKAATLGGASGPAPAGTAQSGAAPARSPETARGAVWEPVSSGALMSASLQRVEATFPSAAWPVPDFPKPALGEAEEVRAATKELAGLPKDILTKLSDAEILEMKRGFDQVDADGSGAIDAAELHSALLSVGETSVAHGDVEGIIARFDDSGDGELQLDEFVQLIMAVRRGDASIGIGGSLVVLLATGNEVSAAASARVAARLAALEPANVRLEGRRVFVSLAGEADRLNGHLLGQALVAMGLPAPGRRALDQLADELADGDGTGVSEPQWLSYVSAAHPLASADASQATRAMVRARWKHPARVDVMRARRFVAAFRETAARDEVDIPEALSARLDEISDQSGKAGSLAREGTLVLQSCGIRDTHVSVLCEALRQVPVAQSLDITKNSVTDAGVAVLLGLLDEQLSTSASALGAGGAMPVVERGIEFMEGFADGDGGAAEPADGEGLAAQQAAERARIIRAAGASAKQQALASGQTIAEAQAAAAAAGDEAGAQFDEELRSAQDEEAATLALAGMELSASDLDRIDLSRVRAAVGAHGLDDCEPEADDIEGAVPAHGSRPSSRQRSHDGGEGKGDPSGAVDTEDGDEWASDLAAEQRNAVDSCIPWIRVNARVPSPLVCLGIRGREALMPRLKLGDLPDGGKLYDPMGRRPGAAGPGRPVMDDPYALPHDDGPEAAVAEGRMADNVEELFRPRTPEAGATEAPGSDPAPSAAPARPRSAASRVLGPVVCPDCGARDVATTTHRAGRSGAFQQRNDVVVCMKCGLARTVPIHFLRTLAVADAVGADRLLTLAKYNLQTNSRSRLRGFLEDRTYEAQMALRREAALAGQPEEPPQGWAVSLPELLSEYKVVIEAHAGEYEAALSRLRGQAGAKVDTDHADELAADFRKYGRSLFAMHQRDYYEWTRTVLRRRAARCVETFLDACKATFRSAHLPAEWGSLEEEVSSLRFAAWASVVDGMQRWTVQQGDRLALQAAVDAVHGRLVAFLTSAVRHMQCKAVVAGEALSVIQTAEGEAWLFGGDRSLRLTAPRIVWLSRPAPGKGAGGLHLRPRDVSGVYGMTVSADGRLVPAGGVCSAVWDGVTLPGHVTFAAITLDFTGDVALGPTIELRAHDRTGQLLASFRLRRNTVTRGAAKRSSDGNDTDAIHGAAAAGVALVAAARFAADVGRSIKPAMDAETLTAPLSAAGVRAWDPGAALVLVAAGCDGAVIHRVELC